MKDLFLLRAESGFLPSERQRTAAATLQTLLLPAARRAERPRTAVIRPCARQQARTYETCSRHMNMQTSGRSRTRAVRGTHRAVSRHAAAFSSQPLTKKKEKKEDLIPSWCIKNSWKPIRREAGEAGCVTLHPSIWLSQTVCQVTCFFLKAPVGVHRVTRAPPSPLILMTWRSRPVVTGCANKSYLKQHVTGKNITRVILSHHILNDGLISQDVWKSHGIFEAVSQNSYLEHGRVQSTQHRWVLHATSQRSEIISSMTFFHTQSERQVFYNCTSQHLAVNRHHIITYAALANANRNMFWGWAWQTYVHIHYGYVFWWRLAHLGSTWKTQCSCAAQCGR